MSRNKVFHIALVALNILFAAAILAPIIYCFNVSMMSLKEVYAGKLWPSRFSLDSYKEALHVAPFFTFIKNSLIVTVVITGGQIVTGALAAYAFSMMRFKGRNLLFMIMLGTMMIPNQAVIIANYLTIANWGLKDTYTALILPHVAAAFAVFTMRQAFLSIPKELKEAADIDGCTNFNFFWRVALPLVKPTIGALGINVFIKSWNYYLWPLLVTDSIDMRTVQIGLSMLQSAESTDFRPVMAGAMIILVPSILAYVLGQKQLISGLTAGSVKG